MTIQEVKAQALYNKNEFQFLYEKLCRICTYMGKE